MNKRNAEEQLSICIPAQVLIEFLNVITWQRLDSPLQMTDAIRVVQDYLDTGVTVLYQKPTQLNTLLDLLRTVTTRKKIFDVALAATLKDHGVYGLYTVNVKDFEEFKFIDAKNPLEKD